MSDDTTFLSVIVPAHQAEPLLPDTLGALLASDLPRERWELIVVDDASGDRTAEVAAVYADAVVRLTDAPRGPAFARNRAAEQARGQVLVFVDSDVRVHPSSLRQIAEHFDGAPSLGALFGSYDDQPPAPGVVSRYRNLLHHHHHHLGAGEAGTFWAGLGAIRTRVFREVGGYDATIYARPKIEDIELGRRMIRAGHRILLDPTVQGTHLKQWRFKDLVVGDLFNRGIPWMTLILREGAGGDLLNVKPREKVSVALVGMACLSSVLAVVLGRWDFLGLGLAAIVGVWALNVDFYCLLHRGRGLGFVVAALPLHLLYYGISGLSAVLGHLVYWRDRARLATSSR